MKTESLTPQNIPSNPERVAGQLFSPANLGRVLLLVAVFLLALSLSIPATFESMLPASADVGQNTLLAIAVLGWVLSKSGRSGERCLILIGACSVTLLGGVALVQAVAGLYPADGPWRVLLNTLPGESAWPGRMSWPAATLFFMLGLAQVSRINGSRAGTATSALLTLIAAFITTSEVTAQLIGLDIYSQIPGVPGSLSPITVSMLLIASVTSGLALLNSTVYLKWEADHVGQGVFLRITALLGMLLVAAVVSAIGLTSQGEWDLALLIVIVMIVFSFLLVYQRIVTVVDNSIGVYKRLQERGLVLAQAQAQAQLGSWRLKLPDETLEWSDQCYEIFGLPKDTAISLEKFLDCVHPDDRALVSEHWSRAQAGEPYDIEHRICVDGETLWVRERAQLLWNEDRSECVCLGTVQNITRAKERELKLIRSGEQIRRLAAHNEIIRENERRMIARELHDELGQHLTAMRMQLAMLQMQFSHVDTTLDQELGALRETVGDLIASSRDVASYLRPAVLDAGLLSAAGWLLDTRLARNNITYQLDCDVDDSQFSDVCKTMLFRVLQESITNVIKHAGAKQVLVSIKQGSCDLVLTISDDGCGFDPDAVDANQHFGLAGIRERVLMLKGQVLVNSQQGSGSAIVIRLPLSQARSESNEAGWLS